MLFFCLIVLMLKMSPINRSLNNLIFIAVVVKVEDNKLVVGDYDGDKTIKNLVKDNKFKKFT